MNKIVLSAALTAALAAPSLALAGNSNVGCGLGTTLIGDAMNDSILLQCFAATTNGTSGNQTFGVTSGTSECDAPSNFVSNERLNEFVHANLDNLAKDIASGSGETLDTVAELMAIPAAERAGLYSRLQAQFEVIFPDPSVEYAHVVDVIAAVANQA
ncbi:MAG: DUF3015 family protein [Nitrospirota bacterium]|jgi:hypothetical protein